MVWAGKLFTESLKMFPKHFHCFWWQKQYNRCGIIKRKETFLYLYDDIMMRRFDEFHFVTQAVSTKYQWLRFGIGNLGDNDSRGVIKECLLWTVQIKPTQSQDKTSLRGGERNTRGKQDAAKGQGQTQEHRAKSTVFASFVGRWRTGRQYLQWCWLQCVCFWPCSGQTPKGDSILHKEGMMLVWILVQRW